MQSEARLCNFLVEINKDHPDEDKDVLHSELATAREGATLTCVWQRLPDRPRTEGSPRVAKREGSGMLSLEGLAWRKKHLGVFDLGIELALSGWS